MPIKTVIKNKDSKVPVKIWTDDLDEKTMQQLENLTALPFVHKHVAVMPDAHLGIGCTIGTVLPTFKAIIPAAVGVDIGCGMSAIKTNLTAAMLPNNMTTIRERIEKHIPTGPGQGHTDLDLNFDREILMQFGNSYFTPEALFTTQSFVNHFFKQNDPESVFDIKSKHWREQLGSLGGGNHFIEICLDESDDVWVMLHSGSRGVGNAIGRTFIQRAKEDMIKHHITNLPDVDLSYFSEGTDNYDEYIEAVSWAQEYAKLNRRVMLTLIFKELQAFFPAISVKNGAFDCHHNYITMENHYGQNVWVTRKGAIRARANDMGIIPGSMGARSFIVRGKGNPESFNSCSHGAGRKMSRRQAMKEFTLEDVREQVGDVNMDLRDGIRDEAPASYKDIATVMQNQDDLVSIVHTLKQIVNIKGD
jgi:tRNA-splicing ligase RtcB (3'-phosphate/5'-hydroxy nucleic acid ligase)